MSTETTLEEELLQEAFDQLLLASWDPNAASADVHRARASRLRQRVAWVRELGRNADALMAAHPRAESGAYMALYKSLTGPIPGAPPKEKTP